MTVRWQRGNYRVTRWCCTSGMCSECKAWTFKDKRKRVVQTENVSEGWAKVVAASWHQFEPVVEKMEEANVKQT